MMGSIVPFVMLAIFGFGGVKTSEQTTLLNRVHRALANPSDKKAWFIGFEKRVKPTDAQTARKIISMLKPNSRAYAELSFVQAYYGVDLPASLDRVQRPYTLWHRHVNQWVREYDFKVQQDYSDLRSNEMIVPILNLLYLKRYDPQILGRWLDLKLDGAWAEGNADEIGAFWQRHAGEMIRVAGLKPSRTKLLAENLYFLRLDFSDGKITYAKERRKLFAEIAPYIRDKNQQTAKAAQALQKAILKEEARYRRETTGTFLH